MIASLLVTQNPVQSPQTLSPAQPNPTPPAGEMISLPAGTSVPLSLMNSIKSKSTKPGDQVRAVVAFPVTVGSRLAIPAGTFAEGTVTQVSARPTANQAPTVRIHFTRLLFTNGYSVTLNAENTQAFLLRDDDRNSTVEVAELTPPPLPGSHFALGGGQSQPLPYPPLPQVGPPKAVVIGAVGGAFAALFVGLLVWSRHHANNYNFVVFDVGWQFQMVLDSQVELDAAQIPATAS
jgi:type IV secretion system protein VirB10